LYGHPIERYVDLLLARQEPDGSWRQMAWWTALGILALQAAEGGQNVFKL
jgi:squalene cyclase